MKIYIAGPMTGYPEFNFPAFHAAAAKWRSQGWEVVNPAEMDEQQDGFDSTTDTAQPHEHYMRRDIPALCGCDAIALLPGWEKSRGARNEYQVAKMCGLSIVTPAQWTGNARSSTLPSDAAARNRFPMADGLLDYFPAALARVAEVSLLGNEQHNPGEPMHWARGKSTDHRNKIIRHLMDFDQRDEEGVFHIVRAAWRCLAAAQELLEREEGAPLPRNAR